MSESTGTCFHCQTTLSFTGVIGRKETCPNCKSDIHVCRNCRHYDRTAYNECREPQAERVLDKDRSNFCDYFVLTGGEKGGSASKAKDDIMRDLDNLFKK